MPEGKQWLEKNVVRVHQIPGRISIDNFLSLLLFPPLSASKSSGGIRNFWLLVPLFIFSSFSWIASLLLPVLRIYNDNQLSSVQGKIQLLAGFVLSTLGTPAPALLVLPLASCCRSLHFRSN